MHFSLAKVGAFAALLASHVGAASIVSRQQVTVESVLQALRGAQLNNLANALQSNPEVVQDVLRSPGAKTLFAPNDAVSSMTRGRLGSTVKATYRYYCTHD